MIIDSPIISGSYAATGSLNQVGNVVITGSLTVTEQITGSINTASYAAFAVSASHTATSISSSFAASSTSASYAATATSSSFAQSAISASNALTASYLSNYIAPFPYTGSAGISGSLVVNGDITSTGTLTAQTLVVQVITSSVDFVTGSTRFGSLVANTHQFTGSVTISGSLAVNDSTAVLTNQTGAMSVATASYVANAVSASFTQTAISASYASAATSASYSNTSTSASYASEATSASLAQSAISASYALTASYASNVPATSSFAVSASVALNAISASYITGSNVIGTVASATSASYALTASYASNVPATSSFAVSASQAQNAVSAAYSAYALTSSYSLAGSGFPFSGSAVITGSLLVTNLSSSGVSYLVADSTGFVTAQTASAAIKSTQAVTSTAGQTSFNITNGYTTGLVDVYINGTKLSAVEYTDTSGTVITLATGSNNGDTVEFVKYFPASGVTNNALRQLTTFTASAAQTVFSASYTPGLLDIYYNGSHLSNGDFTANNGTFFTLATGSAAGDILDVFVYSYQVGAFSGIGGEGVATQVAYFDTTNAITGSPNFTISGSTMTITGSLIVSGSGTFTNIGPSIFSGSVTALQGFSGSFSGTATNSSLLNGSGSGEFVPTGSFNTFSSSILTYTGSANSRLGSIETITGSNITRLGALEITSGSNITRLGALEVASGSAITRLGSIETVTGSNITRLNSLEAKTGSYATTGSNTFIGGQTISGSILQSGSFTTTGTIIAQTINVQTVTSSIIYSSGSNIFGNLLGDSQTFTGSVLITGSLALAGNITGSNITLTGTLNGTSGNFSSFVYVGNGNPLRIYNTGNGDYGNLTFSTATGFAFDKTLTSTGGTFSGQLNVCYASYPEQRITDGTIGYQMYSSTGASDFVVGTYTNHNLIFRTNQVTRLSITNAGAATFSSTITGTTIYGSTAVCSPVGKFTSCIDAGSATLSGDLSILRSSNSCGSYQQISFPQGIYGKSAIRSYSTSNTDAGELRFYTAPDGDLITERMKITSTGAIGIGTTNPGSFFEAYANCTTNLAYFTTSGSANRMIIGATNVGNGALIDIRAHGSVYTESIFGMCATNTVAVIGAPASGCAMLVGTTANNPLVFGTYNVERMRIANTGTATFACGVSVNGLATSANYKLGVTGAAFISGTNSKGVFITDAATYASIVGLNSAISTYNKLELRASGIDGQIMLHTNGNVSIGNPTDTGDQLYLAGNLKMTTNGKIDSNGGYLAINSSTGASVGIGSTPANAKLLVYDSGCTVSLGISCFYNQARGIDIFNANSGTTDNVVGLWISTGPHKAGIASGRTNAASTWEVDLRFYTHPTTIGSLDTTCENMRLYGDGSLVTRAGASSPGLYSDINLKENLLRIPSALNKIQCINGYTFDWKDTAPSRRNPSLLNIIHDAGLIAQEVENILPDIVRNNDLSCTKMLNYNGITALLVEGMKEQQCIINTLKTCLGII